MNLARQLSGLNLERRYPLLLALLATTIWWFVNGQRQWDISVSLSSPLVNVIAISVGFLAAALSILLTAQSLPALDRLKTSNEFNTLVDYHWSAIRLGLISVALCMLVLSFPPCDRSDHWEIRWISIPWFLFAIWSFIAFFRVLALLKQLLTKG